MVEGKSYTDFRNISIIHQWFTQAKIDEACLAVIETRRGWCLCDTGQQMIKNNGVYVIQLPLRRWGAVRLLRHYANGWVFARKYFLDNEMDSKPTCYRLQDINLLGRYVLGTR